MEEGKTTEVKENVINVSTQKNFTFFVFLAKKFLEENESVELHALGSAVSHAVQAADNLIKHKYATLTKIYTESIPLKRRDGGDMKKAKLFIHLKKAPTFQEAVEKFEKEKESRDKARQESGSY